MSPAFSLILRIGAFLLGLLCLYVAIFLYEDSEKKIQNKLENLWVRFDELRELAISRHIAFMRIIGSALTSIGDKIFGAKLISLQFIGVSMCYAFVFWSAYTLFAGWKTLTLKTLVESSDLKDIITYSILGSIPYFISTILPAKCEITTGKNITKCFYMTSSNNDGWLNSIRYLFKEDEYLCLCAPMWINFWFIVVVAKFYGEYICPCTWSLPNAPPAVNTFMFGLMLFMTASALIGTAFFILFVLCTRLSLKKISKSDSAIKSIFWLLLGCVPLPIFYILFNFWIYSLRFMSSSKDGKIESLSKGDLFVVLLLVVIIIAAFINIAFFFATGLFLLLAVVLFIHRILWPLLIRPIYALQKLGIAKRSKLLGTVGSFLIFVAFGKFEWLEKIIDKLNPFS